MFTLEPLSKLKIESSRLFYQKQNKNNLFVLYLDEEMFLQLYPIKLVKL